jgi:hypothetical protein
MTLAFGAACAGVQAATPGLLRATPGKHLGALLVDAAPPRPVTAPSPQMLIGAASRVLGESGATRWLDERAATASLVVDFFGLLDYVSRFPHAYVVTDARAVAIAEGSHRLADLQIALIIETHGDNATISRGIQALLTAHTSSTSARISKLDEFDTTTFTLRDDRLPEWAKLKWGAADSYYVIALGERAFDQTMRSIRGQAPSCVSPGPADGSADTVAAPTGGIELRIHFNAINAALAPVMKGRPVDVIKALGFDGVDHAQWTFTRQDRAIVGRAVYERAGKRQVIPFAVAVAAESSAAKALPEAAGSYMLIQQPVAGLIERIRDAYLASRREEVQTRLREAWRRFEHDTRSNVEATLLDALGASILIHDAPPHPLGIPMNISILLELDRPPGEVGDAVDKLMTQCGKWLADETDGGGVGAGENGVAGESIGAGDGAGGFFRPQLRRDEDGVW